MINAYPLPAQTGPNPLEFQQYQDIAADLIGFKEHANNDFFKSSLMGIPHGEITRLNALYNMDRLKTWNAKTPDEKAKTFNSRKVIIDLILTQLANNNLVDSDHKMIALTYAASLNFWHLSKALIERKADVNHGGNHYNTPLIYACANHTIVGNLETIKLLIDKGANINAFSAKTEYNQTPWDIAAIENSYPELVLRLEAHLLAQKGHRQVLDLLDNKRTDLNQLHNGTTVLIDAILNHYAMSARYLLANGAAVDLKGIHVIFPEKGAITPLNHAAQNCYIPMVNLLLKYRANTALLINRGILENEILEIITTHETIGTQQANPQQEIEDLFKEQLFVLWMMDDDVLELDYRKTMRTMMDGLKEVEEDNDSDSSNDSDLDDNDAPADEPAEHEAKRVKFSRN